MLFSFQRSALVVGLGALACVACWLVQSAEEHPHPSPGSEPHRYAPPATESPPALRSATTSPGAARGLDKPAVASCIDRHFNLVADGISQSQCVEHVDAMQSGSMRTYRIQIGGKDGRSLNIDTAGTVALAASFGKSGHAEFGCESEACGAISIGPADLQGVRTIGLDGVHLQRVDPTAVHASVELSGELNTDAEDAMVTSSACAEQSVLVSAEGAAPSHFCPDDGTGVDAGASDGRAYQFLSIDGMSIVVRFEPNGHLRQIDYGPLFCTAATCAGVTITPPGATGSRELEFAGTLVQSEGPVNKWASLTGHLLLP